MSTSMRVVTLVLILVAHHLWAGLAALQTFTDSNGYYQYTLSSGSASVRWGGVSNTLSVRIPAYAILAVLPTPGWHWHTNDGNAITWLYQGTNVLVLDSVSVMFAYTSQVYVTTPYDDVDPAALHPRATVAGEVYQTNGLRYRIASTDSNVVSSVNVAGYERLSMAGPLVPEGGILALLGGGTAWLAFWRRRRSLLGTALLLAVARTSVAGFVVDHRHIGLFESIPTEYVLAARDLRMFFSDRSVGGNINEALNWFQATSWSNTPPAARRDWTNEHVWFWRTFTQADRNAGLVPQRILFDPDPVLYSRTNWSYEFDMGYWYELTANFITNLAPARLATHDVLSYQFSYLNVTETDTIADTNVGFFAHRPGPYNDVYDLEAFIAQHTNKVFFFWTSSLARSIGTKVSTEFNEQMRAYCKANNKILLDFAAIISHRHDGTPCYDNRDGVLYVNLNNTNQWENFPDDGFDYPAISQDYTTETEGGHLGSVSGGGVRAAKAIWILMARIAGWKPSVLPDEWLWAHDLNWDGSDDYADTDGDGATNYDEYLAGTHPRDPASVLHARTEQLAGQVHVSWPAHAGREYRVYHAEHAGAPWQAATSWLAGTPGTMTWVDSSGLSATQRLYRIAARLP